MKVLVMGLRRGLSRGSPAAQVHVRYLCIGIQCRFSHLSSVKQSIRQASAVIMSNNTCPPFQSPMPSRHARLMPDLPTPILAAVRHTGMHGLVWSGHAGSARTTGWMLLVGGHT